MTARAFNLSERLMSAPDITETHVVAGIDRDYYDVLLKALADARNGRLAQERLTKLEASVLAAILECPDEESYGYELSRRVRSPAASLYKTLARLERQELVELRHEDPAAGESAGRPSRRLYKATAQGEWELGYWRAWQLLYSPSARFLA